MKVLPSLLKVVGFSLLVFSAVVASYAATASALASASAQIVVPVGIVAASGATLNFGQVVPYTGGTVIIAPVTAGARSATGSVQAVAQSTYGSAAFIVTGNGADTFSIGLPASVTLHGTASPNLITVDAFTSNPSTTGQLTAGTQTVIIGATLEVGANQAADIYTGTFNVTVQYN